MAKVDCPCPLFLVLWEEEEEEEEKEEETSSQLFTSSLGLQWIQVPASVPQAFWNEFHTFST